MADSLDTKAEDRVLEGARYAAKYFMGDSDVHHALVRFVTAVDAAGIPYALVGALALAEYGYRRTTEDVDVLLTRAGLARFKQQNLGRGWVDKFPGSTGMRDADTGVGIDVVIAGEYPGDGKPKPVVFPDPAAVAVRGQRVALLPLPVLVELKLASGISAPHRLRDLADVLELVRRLDPDESLADELDPYVRPKFLELVAAARAAGPEE